MLFSIVALIVVVLAIKGITSVVSKSVSKDKDATASSGQVLSGEEESIGDASDQDADSSKDTDKTADADDSKDADTDDSKDADSTDKTAATDDSKDADGADKTADADSSTDAAGDGTTGSDAAEGDAATDTTANVGMVIQNTQVDITNLDTTCLDWGQGSNVDELNRPDGCDLYQEKYGQYNANFIAPADEKVIYLTFDEGYEYGCTPDILATLKEKDVQAVFFVTKPYVEGDPELVQQMIDDGHEVGNHSVTHPSAGLPSETVEQQQNEITENHQYVKDNFGYDMHLFRYPAGKFSEQSLAIINNLNYKSLFWSFAYLDYDVENQPDEAESLQKLVDHLHPGAIFLLHAESWTNTHILGNFIDQARAAGYEFRLFE